MNRKIAGKLAAHDRHQFELKLGYALDHAKFYNNYNVELYFFLPKSLGINRGTYSKRYFFNDIQGYIRFKTPEFLFEDLTDPCNHKSPLTRINTLLDKDPQNGGMLITELKLYACTARVALRNAILPIRRLTRKEETTGLREMVETTCAGIINCLTALRALNLTEVHEDVKRARRHADEYLGIVADDFLNSINNTIADSHLDKTLKKDLHDIIAPIILNEFKYRKEHGYVTYNKDSENELFLYRKGLLKKLITSILFLETHTEKGQQFLQDLLFAVAAGIAMVVATIVTIWAGRRWSITSIPFVLAIVLGYMVKDRVKDWLKLIFSKKMTGWLSDYKTIITDPENGTKIGVCRHAFSFISEKSVPPDILAVRRKGHYHSADFWVPEDIMKYEKEVSLRTGLIIRAHSRLGDITDIIRFNVHRFLEKMDDACETHRAYEPETGNIIDFQCARTYHVNLILKLADQIHRIRLILDKSGLKRVEEVR